MSRPDILFLIYDLERGGPEVRLLELAANLGDKMNFHICVTSRNLAMLADFEKTGARIDVIPVAKPYLEPGKLLTIRKLIRDRRIRVVNVYDIKGLVIASLIKLMFMRNLIVIYNNVNSLDHFNRKNLMLLKLAGKGISKILSNSWFSFNQIKGNFPGVDGKVIHNGVETDTYKRNETIRRETRAMYDLGDKDYLIGTVANFRPQKNYELLIRTFSDFHTRHPQSRLLCAGGGPLLDKMKQYAIETGIADRVIFTGYSNDIPALLNAMDVFVLASSFEGLPNGILQAMSTEVPVISTDVGGCPELIENMQTGILINSGSQEQLDAALERLIENRSLGEQLASNAKTAVDTKFSHQSMLNNYLNFYTTLDHS